MTSEHTYTTVVIGAGHAGLAVGRELQKRGINFVILEESERVGDSWHRRRANIKLNTEWWGSSLPDLTMPNTGSRWPTARDFAEYLDRYARHFALPVALRTSVTGIESSDGGFRVHTAKGDCFRSQTVVLATGPDRVPRRPILDGVDKFSGTVIHSAEYSGGSEHGAESALVIGGGESAADVAVDLARSGATHVTVSMRTPAYVNPPSPFGISAQRLAIAARYLPAPLFDLSARLMTAAHYPDRRALGLGRAPSLHRSARLTGKAPILDRGFMDLVREHRIRVVDDVSHLTHDGAVGRSGWHVRATLVVLATGFETGLDALCPRSIAFMPDTKPFEHAPTTVSTSPGLYFAGFYPSITGNIREARFIARRTASAIARRGRTGRSS